MLWWTIAAAELRRGWLIKRRYPLDLIFSMAGGIIFLVTVAAGAMAVMGGRIELDASWAPRVWGLVLSGLAASAMTAGVGYINSHTYTGTLEQVALSPVPLPSLVLLRMLTSLLVAAPYLTIYALGLLWLFPGFRPGGVLVASVLVVYLGMAGVGMITAGLAVLFKQIQSVLGFITMLFYPVPLLVSASWLESGALLVVPYGLGLRVAMTGVVPVGLALAVSSAWLVCGHFFLRWADVAARRKGVLGLY